jgi:protein TonB
MAFEAYRTQDKARPRRGRGVTYALSLVLHGALIAVGVVYSFWHVDELSPPTLRVTFMSASPPPPPPAPPPAGSGGPRKKTPVKPRTAIVPPRPTDIVQPRETPPPVKPPPTPARDDDDDDDTAGVKGGVKGGVIGGTIGGTPGGTMGGTPGGAIGGKVAAPVAPRTVLPDLAASHKLSGDDPFFPPSMNHPGESYSVLARFCVTPTGAVSTVTIMKTVDPVLDANVVSAVKRWRFSPVMDHNTAIPFCTVWTFQFKGH